MSADAHLPRSLHFSKRELGAYGWPRHTATALGILYDRVLINGRVLPYYYPPQAEVTLEKTTTTEGGRQGNADEKEPVDAAHTRTDVPVHVQRALRDVVL